MKRRTIRYALIALFWLLIWQIGSLIAGSSFLLPSPVQAFSALLSLINDKMFYVNIAATFYRCIAGILLSFVFGIITAVLAYKYRLFRDIIALPVNFLKAVPVMAVIIYAIILLTSANVPILACFLMCYPISHTNILYGLDYLDSQLLEMGKVYGLSAGAMIRHIYIPSLIPQIKASLSLISGLSWKSVVAAEVLAVPLYSMGYELMKAKIYFETDYLFAWVMSIVALSLIFEAGIKKLASMMDYKELDHSKIISTNSVAMSRPSPISDMLSTSTVSINSLSKSFDGKPVLEDFSAILEEGKTTVLMAPSGSGKTTLLRILSGLEKEYAGHICGLQDLKISVLFQEDRLLPWLNVYDNLALVLKSVPGITPAAIDGSIRKILSQLELDASLYKLPRQLSGGMQRRLSLARALLYPSGLMLLDEPFKGLDHGLKNRILASVWPEYTKNKTILLITHDQEDCRLADSNISF